MLYIGADAYRQLLEHAQMELPNEACGLLAGHFQNDDTFIEKVYPLSNVDQSPEHFSMDPKEQLAAIKDMRGLGLALLGNFHSHPNTLARPSPEDIRLAHDPSASYLILSLAGETPVLKAFHIENGAVTPEELVIQGNGGV